MSRSFKLAISLCSIFVLFSSAAMALDYKYISAEDVKSKLENKEPMHLVDIQVEQEFAKHHIPGAMATYSYPVKSEEEKGKLDAIIEKLQADNSPVVVICPRGEGGAKRCYEHLKEKGVAEDRLLILEKGQEGWPYKDLVESN